MSFFINKIVNGKIDESVHNQFQKFSKGEFSNRALLRGKFNKGVYSISTSSEYAFDLIKTLAENLGSNSTHVTGALVSALDLSGFKYKERKNVLGVKKYIIDGDMSGVEIVEICNKITRAFFALSFNTKDSELKIQVKSPKSSKSASNTSKEKLKIDFCKLKTTNKNIIDDLIFETEARNFKNIEIKHNFIIEQIIIPDSLKNEKDFAKVREMSIRKGKIIREIDVDGVRSKKEVPFEA